MNKSQNQEISSTFSKPQILVLAILGLLKDWNERRPYPFIYFN